MKSGARERPKANFNMCTWKETRYTDLGVLENEQICLVVSLQEFEIELHRFLSGENLSKLVVGRLRCLGGNEYNINLV